MNNDGDSAARTPPRRVSRASLREMIKILLKGDVDLEGFALDYFKPVQARFSAGMERDAKISILLRDIKPEDLVRALRCHDPEGFAQHLDILRPPLAPVSIRHPRSPLIVLAVLVIVVTVARAGAALLSENHELENSDEVVVLDRLDESRGLWSLSIIPAAVRPVLTTDGGVEHDTGSAGTSSPPIPVGRGRKAAAKRREIGTARPPKDVVAQPFPVRIRTRPDEKIWICSAGDDCTGEPPRRPVELGDLDVVDLVLPEGSYTIVCRNGRRPWRQGVRVDRNGPNEFRCFAPLD